MSARAATVDRAGLADLRDAFLAKRLERALSRLGNVIHFMNTGAHPDDEHSTFLAWLRFGRGVGVSIACSTRGEGGQNIAGPERGARLGLLRSTEMEHAAAVLDADVHWLGFGPQDQVFDFGFSKSGSDTLARWGGADVMIGRMVALFRKTRPDIILPTFLDVPGQHGHHRAMTAAALAAWRLAGDPSYHISNATIWKHAKFYLPSWSGGGSTYDDELPPPPASVTEIAMGREPWTGARWTEIGEASRLCHGSQDMGDPQAVRDADRTEIWPLHRVDGAAENDILDGLPRSWGDLADRFGGPRLLGDLGALVASAQQLRGSAFLAALAEAGRILEAAQPAQSEAFRADHGHRLARQRHALDHAMLLAAGLLPERIGTRDPVLAAGGTTGIDITQATTARISYHLPKGLRLAGNHLTADPELSAESPFRADYQILGGGSALFAEISAEIDGQSYTATLDLDAPALKPAGAEPFAQSDLVLRRQDGAIDWPPALDLPEGIALDPPLDAITRPLADPHRRAIDAGLYHLVPHRNGRALSDWQSAGRIGERALHLAAPRVLRLLALDLNLPRARIGYVAGSDNSLPWLQAAGFAPEPLAAITAETDLSRFDSLLIGSVAFGMVAGLAAAAPHLHEFVRAGGNLVTLYQRPDQGWNAATIPPARLAIGQPSLRWRVTDPAAEVRLLAPDHPLLHGPNRITAADWQGWDKDRGLYFAADWDPAYQPLLAMSDAGEAPLHGALLSGRFGAGRHSHVALGLPHQMASMVPGAYRLMANLLQPA